MVVAVVVVGVGADLMYDVGISYTLSFILSFSRVMSYKLTLIFLIFSVFY